MKKKEFFVKDWLKIDHKPQAPITKPVIESSLEEQIDALVSAVESASVDIAPSYDDWRDLGFALADTLGEGGRSYYHRLSRFYPSYDEAKTDKQFDACLKAHGSGITINTFALEPGQTVETRLSNAGVYIVQSADGKLLKKLTVR